MALLPYINTCRVVFRSAGNVESHDTDYCEGHRPNKKVLAAGAMDSGTNVQVNVQQIQSLTE